MAGGSPKRRLEAVPDVVEPDDLWALDPTEFVAARDHLVRHLRRQGERDRAAEVAGWRRPTPSVWALNHLARVEPAPLRQVLDSAATLADAVPLGGDGLRRAQATHRDAVEDAVTAASRVSGVDGSTHLGRMRDTLLAGGADAAVAEQLRAGTLHRDHDPPGFAAGLGGTPVERGTARHPARPAPATARTAPPTTGPAPPKAAPTGRGRRADRAEQEARRRERARLERRAAQSARRAAQLEEQAEAAEARAVGEREAADEARREADDAAAELARTDAD